MRRAVIGKALGLKRDRERHRGVLLDGERAVRDRDIVVGRHVHVASHDPHGVFGRDRACVRASHLGARSREGHVVRVAGDQTVHIQARDPDLGARVVLGLGHGHKVHGTRLDRKGRARAARARGRKGHGRGGRAGIHVVRVGHRVVRALDKQKVHALERDREHGFDRAARVGVARGVDAVDRDRGVGRRERHVVRRHREGGRGRAPVREGQRVVVGPPLDKGLAGLGSGRRDAHRLARKRQRGIGRAAHDAHGVELGPEVLDGRRGRDLDVDAVARSEGHRLSRADRHLVSAKDRLGGRRDRVGSGRLGHGRAEHIAQVVADHDRLARLPGSARRAAVGVEGDVGHLLEHGKEEGRRAIKVRNNIARVLGHDMRRRVARARGPAHEAITLVGRGDDRHRRAFEEHLLRVIGRVGAVDRDRAALVGAGHGRVKGIDKKALLPRRVERRVRVEGACGEVHRRARELGIVVPASEAEGRKRRRGRLCRHGARGNDLRGRRGRAAVGVERHGHGLGRRNHHDIGAGSHVRGRERRRARSGVKGKLGPERAGREANHLHGKARCGGDGNFDIAVRLKHLLRRGKRGAVQGHRGHGASRVDRILHNKKVHGVFPESLHDGVARHRDGVAGRENIVSHQPAGEGLGQARDLELTLGQDKLAAHRHGLRTHRAHAAVAVEGDGRGLLEHGNQRGCRAIKV